MEIITESAEETKNLGRKIADSIIRSNKDRAVVCLSGNLGSGKTTFVQGFADRLEIRERIISPTFILLRKYDFKVRGNNNLENFYHIDVYRLEGDLNREIKNIGLDEIWKDAGNVVVIEWAEKIKDFLPADCSFIKFDYIDETKRRITLDE